MIFRQVQYPMFVQRRISIENYIFVGNAIANGNNTVALSGILSNHLNMTKRF